MEAFAGILYRPDLTAPLAFDAVWTLTFALKRTIAKIERGIEGGCSEVEGDLVPLEQFDYRNKKLGCLLRESMDETDFLGISVRDDLVWGICGTSVHVHTCMSRVPATPERSFST